MTPGPDTGAQARIIAAALRTWTTTDNDPTPPTVRITIRQPPTWQYVSTHDLTTPQQARLLDFLRNDLATEHAHHPPETAARIIQGLITEQAAAGHRYLTTADLANAAARIGRSRSWIAAHISDLIEQGQLLETRRPDRFRIR